VVLKIGKTTPRCPKRLPSVQNDSPVMNTLGRLDSLVVNTLGSLSSPVVNTRGGRSANKFR